MAKQVIGRGTVAGDGTGDTPFDGVGKINANFTELYDAKDAQAATLAAKAPLNNPIFTGTVQGVTKAMVGLGNVDNVADNSKPVSTAQAASILAGDNARLKVSDIFANFVASGLATPVPTNSLDGTLSVGVAYVGGTRVEKSSGSTYTYLATRDTYVDISDIGTITRVPVVNGAAEPAVTANSMRLEKVVTDATKIALVTRMCPSFATFGSSKMLTVGEGGQYATIQEAINAAGSRIVNIHTAVEQISAIHGVGTINVTGLSVDLMFGPGDLIQVADGTRYFKIKATDLPASGTLTGPITLYEPFQGVSGASYFVPTEIRIYRIDPVTIVLLPGQHDTTTVVTTTGTVLQPGINLLALDGASLFVSESSTSPNWLFQNLYENTFTRIHARGKNNFRDMDSFGKASPNAWAGAELNYIECDIDHLNKRTHSNGISQAPALKAGFTRFIRSTVREAKNGWLLFDGAVAATNDNTIVEFIDSVTIPMVDSDAQGINMNPISLGLMNLGTYNFYNHRIIQPVDYAMNPDLAASTLTDNWGCLHVSAACIVNWHGGAIDIKNTSGVASNTVGLETAAAAVISLFNTSIKASGTGATGILNAGATINLHNTYVEGATNSINNVSGTVNVEKGCTLNGPVTGTLTSTVRGVVTLNGTTPVTVTTGKVHTNSRIKLSRQTAGGTMGHFAIGTITNNTSFTLVGQAGDTSVVMWELEH